MSQHPLIRRSKQVDDPGPQKWVGVTSDNIVLAERMHTHLGPHMTHAVMSLHIIHCRSQTDDKNQLTYQRGSMEGQFIEHKIPLARRPLGFIHWVLHRRLPTLSRLPQVFPV